MAKDINVSYGPVSYTYTPDFKVNLSKKWEEGMWSMSGVLNPKCSNSNEPASLIGEQFSGADYLKKNTFARGLNEIQTKGCYNNTWVRAKNYSALRKGWLSCSLIKLLVAKEAYVEPKDPMLVHFRIFLNNRLNDTMAGSCTRLIEQAL